MNDKILEENLEKEIRDNPSYIMWLEKFTEKYPKFSNDKFLILRARCSEEDIRQINLLHLLFNVIDKYARDNYIYPVIDSEHSGYYNFKYNDIGYKLGYDIGQRLYIYCERVKNIDESFIDYHDILRNKKQSYVDSIDKVLKDIKKIIAYCYEQGISIEILKKSLYELLNNIDNQIEKEKVKRK